MKIGNKVVKKTNGFWFQKGDTGTITKIYSKSYIQVNIKNMKKWLQTDQVYIYEK